jgi:hypothetical protein
MSPLEHDVMQFHQSLTVLPPLAGRPVLTGRYLDLDAEVSRAAFTAAFVNRHELSETDLAALDGAVERHIGPSIRVNAACWDRLSR